MKGKQAQLGHVKAVSSVLFGRINGEKIIPYKKHILYNYNGLIILNLIKLFIINDQALSLLPLQIKN